MKILIFWDIYWRIGRKAFIKEYPKLKSKYNPDFSIVNIENISSWRWPIEEHILKIEKLWVDIMTWWDHILDNIWKIENYLNNEKSILLRPANFFETDTYKIPWKWYKIIKKWSKKILVIHLLWNIFMNHKVYNPFIKVEEILNNLKNEEIDATIIDFHKEATSEWYWMAHLLDSRVSFIFWTHTHVQTNDEIILPGWTWFISDVWMNWPLYWIIWADFETVKKRFITWINKWKIGQNLQNDYLITWVCIEIWNNKMCEKIEKIKIIWKL